MEQWRRWNFIDQRYLASLESRHPAFRELEWRQAHFFFLAIQMAMCFSLIDQPVDQ
jgi:hypothetical protein